MSKHTKGLWRVQPPPSNVGGCRSIQANKAGTHKQAQWTTEVCYTVGLSNDEEDKANARLIAAAPELLEALEDARKAIAGLDKEVLGTGEAPDGSHFWYLQHELLNKIGAAIAKAESK